MGKVKVLLEAGEDRVDVDNELHKALEHHVSGDVHMNESFEDPAMVDASHHMKRVHDQIYNEMIREIIDALDEDYTDGNLS